jgi:hypothetical protein
MSWRSIIRLIEDSAGTIRLASTLNCHSRSISALGQELALSMATQPEIVIAYSSWASALPPLLSPPWISLRNGCPDCA